MSNPATIPKCLPQMRTRRRASVTPRFKSWPSRERSLWWWILFLSASPPWQLAFCNELPALWNFSRCESSSIFRALSLINSITEWQLRSHSNISKEHLLSSQQLYPKAANPCGGPGTEEASGALSHFGLLFHLFIARQIKTKGYTLVSLGWISAHNRKYWNSINVLL